MGVVLTDERSGHPILLKVKFLGLGTDIKDAWVSHIDDQVFPIFPAIGQDKVNQIDKDVGQIQRRAVIVKVPHPTPPTQ